MKEAKNQIEMAEPLGYDGRKKEYRDLYDQLKEIEKKVSGGKSGSGFFDEITATFRQLFDRKPSENAKRPPEQSDKAKETEEPDN